jgi:hypothetical protein
MEETLDVLEARVERLVQDVSWLRAMLRQKAAELAAARRSLYGRLIRPVSGLLPARNGHR